MNSIYCLNQPVSTSDFDNAQFACEFYQNANAQVAQPYKPEIYAMMEALSPDGPGKSTTKTASANIVLFIQYRIK